MAQQQNWQTSTVAVRRATPEDAAALTGCFERCYGATYANPLFYDLAALGAAIADGTLRSVVAATKDGRVVGHTGLTVHQPGARAVEAGNTVVDPDRRGQGLLGQLGTELRTLCTAEGFCSYVHYPTTAHAIMQRRSVSSGGVETGLMLAYVPQTTDYLGLQRSPAALSARIATTVVHQPCGPASPTQRVWVPEAYLELVRDLYRQCGLPRELMTATTTAADTETGAHMKAGASSASAWSHRFHARRGLLSVTAERSGPGLAAGVAELLRRYAPPLAHVDLPLAHSPTVAVLDDLGALGFLFCGLLPDFAAGEFAGDVLRLQRLDPAAAQPFDLAGDSLANTGARALLGFIRAEADRHGPRPGGSP